jgi:hypothetical protein
MRYFRPRSLTWWASATPIALGLVVATVEMHGYASVVAAINQMTGGATAYTLINTGLVGIGLRDVLARGIGE